MNDGEIKALRQRARKMKTSELVREVMLQDTIPTLSDYGRACVSVCAAELDERIPARET